MQDQSTPSVPLKLCRQCGEQKPLDVFPIGKSKPVSPCRACVTARTRRWKSENIERVRAQDAEYARQWRRDNDAQYQETRKAWRTANPGRVQLAVRTWNAKNPERIAAMGNARQAVYRAIHRGELIRATVCEECGATGRQITAAHHDYSKPLDVRWLCRSCHSRYDHADPKTLR